MLATIDKPITSFNQDLLNRQHFIKTLASSLVETKSTDDGVQRCSTGYVVGLTGEWGAGKSSVLNLLAEYLGTLKGVIVVNFNPWIFKGHEDLIEGFFNELTSALGKSAKEKVHDLLGVVDRYRDAISAGASAAFNSVAPGSGLVSTAAIASIPKYRRISIADAKRALEERLAALNLAVVVLIDELDRVEDDEVRSVARLIKAAGQIKGLSYLVAYDPLRVAEALGRGTTEEAKTKNGEAYLEKIIQLAVPLRPLMDYEVNDMLAKALVAKGYSTFGEGYEAKGLFPILTKTLSTPRDIKRVVGNFAAIEPMVRGEVNAFDVLGYTCLLAKAPSIRTAIARNLDAVVDDPAEEELIARIGGKKKPTVVGVFGTAGEDYAPLLQWMFPVLGEAKGDESDENTFNRDRIRKRRNLLRLLYLGNPPHDIPRSEIIEFWHSDTAGAETKLHQMMSALRFRSFVDRFRDLFPSLDPRHDDVIWPTISRCLIRDHDWISGIESQRLVVDDLEQLLRVSGASSDQGRERSRAIVRTLTNSDDLQIVPALLRAHIFKYGLGVHGLHGGYSKSPVIYDSDESLALLNSEASKYREAILSGYAIRRLVDGDAIFLLLNMNLFDESLRASLTEQLMNFNALITFACLVVPAGYGMEYKTLATLTDVDRVNEALEHLIQSDEFARSSDTVQTAVRNLRLTASKERY